MVSFVVLQLLELMVKELKNLKMNSSVIKLILTKKAQDQILELLKYQIRIIQIVQHLQTFQIILLQT